MGKTEDRFPSVSMENWFQHTPHLPAYENLRMLKSVYKMVYYLHGTHACPSVYFKSVVPTFLAPGTSFMEDNFSMDWGGDGFVMIQAH